MAGKKSSGVVTNVTEPMSSGEEFEALKYHVMRLEDQVRWLLDNIYVLNPGPDGDGPNGKKTIRHIFTHRELDEKKPLWTSLWARLR